MSHGREAHTGRPAATDTIGLDLHKRESQRCILTEDGELIQRRIAATRERCTAVLGLTLPKAGRTAEGERPARVSSTHFE